MPRLPSKVATLGVPEWDASVNHIRDLILSMRPAREALKKRISDTREALDNLARRAYRAGLEEVGSEIRRMGYDLADDLRTTALLTSLKGVDEAYHRTVDHPFSRVANADLVAAWGRTLR